MSLLRAIEAAYSDEPEDQRWLTGVAEAVAKPFHASLGVSAVAFRARPGALPEVTSVIYVGGSEKARRALQGMFDLDPQIAEALFSRGFVCGSISQLMGPSYHQNQDITRYLRKNGVHDSVGFSMRDVTGRGLAVSVARAEIDHLSPATIERYSLVAAHLAAGQRLRDQKQGVSDPFRLSEAVLSPAGKLHHAEAAAQSRQAREALRTAAVAIDRARSGPRRGDDDEALRFWRALVAGRWSLVDHFDSDGRRFLLARRNDAQPSAAPKLSLKERQAAAYASLGHSNKLIGYHLGISATAVSTRLGRAARKLRVSSRAELIDLWRTFEDKT